MARANFTDHLQRIERAEGHLGEIHGHIERIVDRHERERALDIVRTKVYRPTNAVAANDGDIIPLYDLPEGETWEVERITITGPASATLILALGPDASAVNAVYLCSLSATNSMWSDTFSTPLHVPDALYARVSTRGTYTINLQVTRARIAAHEVASAGIQVEHH